MRILIVEDQNIIGKAIQTGLREESLAVDWATTIDEAHYLLGEFEYDTVVLDLMLPDGFGYELLQSIRAKKLHTPVLILTAKDSIDDKLEGFRLGADDYLTKPFIFQELLSRIQVLIRRKYQFYGNLLEVGELKLDTRSRIAKFSQQQLNLTAKEFAVLELFLLSRGNILSRNRIAQHIYDENGEQGSNVIDVFINKLRRKLEAAGAESLIETVRGEGYVIR